MIPKSKSIQLNKEKEREFSIEKIAKAIRCENIISSLRNKYHDPLFIYQKSLLPKLKTRNININKDNSPFSFNKILYREFIKQRQSSNENEENKAIQTKNNTAKRLIPLITNNKIKEKLLSYKKPKNKDNLLITSGMFKSKDEFEPPKIKLASIIASKMNGENEINNLYGKIENINKMNEKYNLQLDLNHLDNNVRPPVRPKRMSKKGLMNYLFQKYVTSSNTRIKNDNLDDINNSNNYYRHKSKIKNHKKSISLINHSKDDEMNKANSLDMNDSEKNINDIGKMDYLSENSNTFLTKMDMEGEKKEISDYKKSLAKLSKLQKDKSFENNKKIIDYDQKITIDCLRSNVDSKIEHKKLIYKNIDKTTFSLQKEATYQKVKKFETIIDNLVKN